MNTDGEIAAIRERLGQNIRRLRQEHGWSQYQFSQIVPINRSYLVEVEHGRRNVAIDNIIKISRALDVTVSELCANIEYDSSISRTS